MVENTGVFENMMSVFRKIMVGVKVVKDEQVWEKKRINEKKML